MKRKAKQPRLLSPLAPVREGDALDFAALTTSYRCRCGNTAETGIKLDAVVCIKCGLHMRAQA